LREVVGTFEAEDLGFVDRSLEGCAVEDGGEVEEGSGWRGDGDAVARGDLVGVENGSVKEEPGTLTGSTGHRQFDAAAPRAEDPERAGRPVAQDSIGREGCGHPMPSL
jgi:hypothetical protein